MRRIFFWIATLAVIGGVGAVGYKAWALSHAPEPTPEQVTVQLTNAKQEIVEQVLAQRAEQIVSDSKIDLSSTEKVTVLLIGLDARKGQTEPHCDAIHFFTFDLTDWSITITSVPRGTYSALPPGREWQPNQFYVSNACEKGGLAYGVQQMEKISGLQADYVVTAGFSQAEGVFRMLKLPAEETLQWLRHRQSYAIGDPQRSHNQALFMKDMLVAHVDDFENELTAPLQYILFTMVNTDMDFSLARSLLKAYVVSDIAHRPDDIHLQMIPYHATVDYHYDASTLEQDLQQKIDFMEPLLTPDDLTGLSNEQIQAQLVAFLEDQLDSDESVAEVIEQQLWLQISEDSVREQFQFAFAERYFNELLPTDQATAVKYLTDYILAKQVLGPDTYIEQAKADIEAAVEE